MPTCRCGTTIQSGQRCRDCTLDDLHFGFKAGSEVAQDDDPVLVECTADDCGTRYWRHRDDSCPNCGSDRRRYAGPIEDAGHPVPLVRASRGPLETTLGPDPQAYGRVNGRDHF